MFKDQIRREALLSEGFPCGCRGLAGAGGEVAITLCAFHKGWSMQASASADDADIFEVVGFNPAIGLDAEIVG